jgi:supervillin
VKLAALAAKVDFQAAAKAIISRGTSNEKLEKDTKLILVKGRRHIQVRLLEPKLSSMNDGDSFVITSEREVFVYIGSLSNKIESTKALDVADNIVRHHDYGVHSEAIVTKIVADNLQRESAMRSALGRLKKLLTADEDDLIRGNQPNY